MESDNLKVLIGEEDRASRTILEKTMDVMDHKVKAVEDPDELMDILDRKKDIDLVFLGMKLKGKSGLDLTKDILEKKIDNRPYTILVASEDQDIDLVRALEKGSPSSTRSAMSITFAFNFLFSIC